MRGQNPFFALTWTAIHPITRESPLHGLDARSMTAEDMSIVAILIGFDETFAQTVHARYAWRAEDVAFGSRFVDVLSTRDDGLRQIDYTRFHDIVPDATSRIP